MISSVTSSIPELLNMKKYPKEVFYIGNLELLLEYCKNSPLYDEAILKYPNEILEYELEGKIKIENGKVFII